MASTVRRLLVVASIVLLALPVAAHAGLSCLSACNPNQKNNDCCLVNPDFGAACATYTALQDEAEASLSREAFDACVAGAKACQPGTAGRCTIIHGCVEGCRQNFFPHVPEAQIQQEAFGAPNFLCDGRPLKSQGRKSAAKACRKCDPASVATTTTVSTSSSSTTSTSSSSTTSTSSTTVAGHTTSTGATTSTTTGTPTTTVGERILPIRDRCFNDCLHRLDSVRRCYRRCASACEGDYVALPICQRSCRNAFCLAIKARCTFNEPNADKIDPAYSACCCNVDDPNDPNCNNPDAPDCRTPDEAECETTTTTSSTSTSTSSSVPVPSSTTTTSPQIP